MCYPEAVCRGNGAGGGAVPGARAAAAALRRQEAAAGARASQISRVSCKALAVKIPLKYWSPQQRGIKDSWIGNTLFQLVGRAAADYGP